MIISRLALKNWRNFRTLDLQLSDRVIIIGPNASGKSNLLDHSVLTRYRPARRRPSRRQILMSTHSWELLSEKGIGGEEVVVLTPDQEGTTATLASSVEEVRRLLESGLSVAEAALPRTVPPQLSQLDLFQ
jgi:predicted ATPase